MAEADLVDEWLEKADEDFHVGSPTPATLSLSHSESPCGTF